MDPRDAGRAARSLETLHAMCYFVPEVEEEITALGVRRGRAAYFAGRSAPMGRVGPGPVTATFFVFHPGLVATCVTGVWDVASPEDVHAARLRGVDRGWRRLLGDDVCASAEVVEAAALVEEASAACRPEGRTLFAAHADLAWPEEPHLRLWWGLTLLREHRGDGHVAVLVERGLSGLEALRTHTATGKGFTVDAARVTRGFSEEEWDACGADLVARGLLTEDGGLTDDGRALRKGVEIATERLAVAPWDALGEERTARLAALGAPLVQGMLAGGVFPPGVFA